jgi:hypothetical protein
MEQKFDAGKFTSRKTAAKSTLKSESKPIDSTLASLTPSISEQFTDEDSMLILIRNSKSRHVDFKKLLTQNFTKQNF